MIISHESPEYRMKWAETGVNGRFNGAYYYSKEIVENIIPRIKTDYNWVTINTGRAMNHSIIFIHNNLTPEETYDYLKQYKDLILVVGVPDTIDKVKHLGKVIYLPLSVDVSEVEKYKKDVRHGRAYVGRISKFYGHEVDGDYIGGFPREILLERMSRYAEVYAVGRVAIEALVLGCKILPYDPRYPDPTLWKILDNKEAAKMLQHELDMLK